MPPNTQEELRKAAEVKLALVPLKNTQNQQVDNLLHELQIHQIELEMQNETLRQSLIALEESRDRYVDLFDFAPTGYVNLNQEGMIQEVNLTGSMLFGKKRNELVNHRFAPFVATEDRDRWHVFFQSVLKTHNKITCQLTLLSNEGSHIYTHLDCLRQEKDGQEPLVRIVITDITEQKATLEALKESESLLRLSQKVGKIGSWEADLINNRQTWSDNCIALLGFPHLENPTWKDFLEFVHPNDRPLVVDATQAHLDHGTKYDVEFRVLTKDGDIRWMRSTGQAERDSTGRPIKMRGIGQDITLWKNNQEALRNSEERYQNVFQSSLDAININRLNDGLYIDINPAFTAIMGYCRDEIVGHTSLELNIWVDPLERNRLVEVLQRESMCRNLEACFRSKSGKIKWGSMSATIIEIDGAKCILSVTRDITDSKQAEEEQRIAAIAFESQEGMFVTDQNSVILRVNNAFSRITGFDADEVIGNNPRILSSGRQNASFYASMWDSINRTGSWEGEIWNKRKNGEIYPEKLTITTVKNSDGIITNYVATLTDITLSRKAAEQIELLAFYDTLTRLPNRRLLLDRLKISLASSCRTGEKGALLFLDLDNFKTLNDTQGHDVGDQLFQQVALCIESCVREGDTVARLGGDEFVVMLEDLSKDIMDAAAQTEAVGAKILKSLSQPFNINQSEYHNSVSIGATLFSNNELEIDELMKQADIAMYQAKKAGRNSMRFFDNEMQQSINDRAFIEKELHIAIENQDFQPYYQIQVDNSHRALGAEVLIRWIHPERGLISPAEFIPLAEETGMILSIGKWVLDMACAQLKSWQRDAITRELTLSVNVSAKQFHESNFVAQVQDAVIRHGINPKQLKLEPTESVLLENIEDTIATMIALKEIGIRFALDDFGTGFSSLQYLKKLPLYQLKIDQSFVKDLVMDKNDQSIVRTIIAMAQSLNLEVIAEGVESEEQKQILENHGCNHYQGYLFGKPMPIGNFDELLRRD